MRVGRGAAFCMAEKCSRVRSNGEHCLSGASCAAAGLGKPRREPNGPCRADMVLGPFVETKGPRRVGAKPH